MDTECPDCGEDYEYVCEHIPQRCACSYDEKEENNTWFFRGMCLYCILYKKREYEDDWDSFREVALMISAALIERGFKHASQNIPLQKFNTLKSSKTVAELYKKGYELYSNR